jgi:hypothetical protein
MGNTIGSFLIQSLRQSLSGTTIVSQTSTTPPVFVQPTDLPGSAKAWVSFDGIVPPNTVCNILNKSANITTVSANGLGDYIVGFTTGTFANSGYVVGGSVHQLNLEPLSSANGFIVRSIASLSNLNRLRILTYNSAISSNGFVTTQAAYAGRVNLIIYK